MTALVHYDEMCRAIEQAYRVDEVKDMRDKAMALEAYARQAKNTEAERRACEIRLRAERKVGQLLIDMAKSGERPKGRPEKELRGATLSDLGVSRNQSSRWQQLADVPEEAFERSLTAADKPTTSGIVREHQSPPVRPVDPAALWLWGRLHDFERTHLHRDPADVLATLTPNMLADVLRLAPLVAGWLDTLEEADGKSTRAAAA